MALLTLGLSAPLLYTTLRDGWPLAVLLALALPTLVMTSRLAIDLVNWLVTLSVTPACCRAWISARACPLRRVLGGGAHADGQCRRYRGVGRGAGSALSGQS
ncbi:hypothetical protein NWF32_24890 [Pseudomonas qingdaonensis]|nr:hypothetical protein [Pseudomonas qingdaonensis]